jgi:hypothetical protein
VILLDVGVLIYAVAADLPQHPSARPWLDRSLSGTVRVGLPWHSLLGFWRITTNPRAFARPLGADEAWSQIEEWLDRPAAYIPVPGDPPRASPPWAARADADLAADLAAVRADGPPPRLGG